MSTRNLNVELNLEELDTLMSILHDEIINHSSLIELQIECGELTKEQKNCNLQYAKYVEGIKNKLLAGLK